MYGKGLSRNVINNYIFLYYIYYVLLLKHIPIFMIIIHVNIKSWVQSLQLYIDRYIDLYVCKYMIYHCIYWWTMAFYVDIYMNFCFINICLIPISTNFVVVFIHVSTCNFINIRWMPIFVEFLCWVNPRNWFFINGRFL